MNSRSQEYNTIHKWLAYNKKKTGTCNDCGISGLIGRKIHWSNLSGLYKRDLSDWIELCARCHQRKDERYKPSYYFADCLSCNDIFPISPSRIGTKLFCSMKCYAQYRIGKSKNIRFRVVD